MANLVVNKSTSLAGEEVVVRSVQFFTGERWRAQSQSARVSTFVGRPPIPLVMLILTFLGFLFFIVPGIIMYVLVVRKMVRLQNIVVTANPQSTGSDVVITYPAHAAKLVARFLEALPANQISTAAAI